MERPSNRYSAVQFGAMFAIIVAAALLRLKDLGDQSLWTDEAFSLWFAQQPFDYLWTFAPRIDPHPPLYYSLLRLWRTFGETEAALRSMSVLFSIAALPFVWLGTRKLLEEHPRAADIALLAALLVAVAPMQVKYAQEARAYAAFSFAVALLFYAGAHIAKPLSATASRARRAMPWALAAAAMTLTVWFHYSGLFYCAAFGPFLLYNWVEDQRLSRRYLVCALVTTLAVFAAFLPQLGWLTAQAKAWHTATWVPPPTYAAVEWSALKIFGAKMLPGGQDWSRPILVGLVAISFFGGVTLWRRGLRSACVLLLLLTFLPFLLSVVTSWAGLRVLVYRTLLPSTLTFAVLVAVGVLSLPGRMVRVGVAGTAVVLLAGSTIAYTIGEEKEPWREIAVQVAAKSTAGDLVVVLPNEAQIPLLTYLSPLKDDARLIVAPAPFPAADLDAPYPSGAIATPAVTPSSAAAVAAAAREVPGRVLVVSRNRTLFDPTDAIGSALSKERRLAGSSTWWSNVIELKEFELPAQTAPLRTR